MNLDLVRALFAQFIAPPAVTVDEPTGALVVGPFTISAEDVQVNGLVKTRTVKKYTLDVHVGDGEVMDLETGTDFQNIVTKLVGHYAEWQARNKLDDLATDALAQSYQEDRQALTDAFKEGYEYYRRTQPGLRNFEDNPYPYGIDHYAEWRKGFYQGEAEAVF